jgi:hypothetical protein
MWHYIHCLEQNQGAKTKRKMIVRRKILAMKRTAMTLTRKSPSVPNQDASRGAVDVEAMVGAMEEATERTNIGSCK